MCIIIANHKGIQLSSDMLLKCATLNPHGLGVTWLDTFETELSLSSDWKVLMCKRPYIAHFRFATIGDVSLANNHPFEIGETGNMLYQNGSMYNLGSDTMTDTEHMSNILRDTSQEWWGDVLESNDCRWCIVDTKNKEYELFNEDLWIESKGVLYSKSNVIDHEIVAVYGTLKQGHGNNSVMGVSKLISKGKTLNKYPMVESGIPYVLPRKGEGHNIVVETYLVDKNDMYSIDSLEGHPSHYVRRKTHVRLDDGVTIVRAWLYFMPHKHVDTGVYIEEYRPAYSTSYPYIEEGYSITAHTCTCSSPSVRLDEYDTTYYCDNCLGAIRQPF